MTALVGPFGSGKSTVAKLIAGYWDVTSGSITLGGHELKEIPLSEIAAQISYVSQDNYLFNRSIRENIRMGRPYATDAEVEQAAKQSGCDTFIRKLDQGYDALKQVVVRVFSVLLLLASIYFWLNGSLSLAYGVILVIASFMVFNDLENAGNMASLLQMLAASMDTANSIDDTPVMDEKGADVVPASSEIVFDNVDFSYKVNGCGADREGGLGHADRKILDHVSFTIPAGTTTAIVGPSGSGKTTMCNLIARFWDVDAGRITVGGKDVRDFKLDSLMENISMVFQNVYLFADSIENNIKFGCPDATHEQVVEAAKKACCHEFISALPDGYDTVIGEGGGTLSGGEKQRISIARAILKDAPIIILDEATSSVDPENEEELQRAIAELTHDKTIIIIAHRLKTVRGADQILVLDDSHIVQRGTHAELIQQKGLYADFVSARQEAIGWKLAQ